MAKTGPKSKHPSGMGYTTSKGYHRLSIWNKETKQAKLIMAHVFIWEQANGPVPKGYQIHHKNHDKQDNRLENLELVDTITHKRLHSGCELKGGIWWKPCGICHEFKPVNKDNWYLSPEGWPLYGRCKPCHCAKVCKDARLRVEAAKGLFKFSELEETA